MISKIIDTIDKKCFNDEGIKSKYIPLALLVILLSFFIGDLIYNVIC